MSAEASGVVSFHRPARVHPEPVPAEPIVLAAPPSVPPAMHGTWLQILLPVVGSLGIVGFALVYRNTLFLAIAGGIALLTVTLWIAIRVQQSRGARRRRREDIARYRAYLVDQRTRIEAVAAAQRRRLDRLYPDPDRLWAVVTSHRGLWERRQEDDDFMHVRIGLGDVPLATPLQLDLGSNPLTEFEPDLLAQGRELVDSLRTLRLAQVVIPAGDLGTLAVVGGGEDGRALVRAMLAQLASFHAPDDLRILAWFRPQDEAAWGWMKWLPHTRESAVGGPEDRGQHRVGMAVEPTDLEVLLAQLARPRLDHMDRIREAGALAQSVRLQQAVVVIDGYEPDGLAGRLSVLDELMTRAREIGVLVITLVKDPDAVPATVGARIDLAEGGWMSYAEAGPHGRREHGVRADVADPKLCEALARAMAPLRLRARRGRTTTVDSEGVLELLGLAAADRIDARTTWGSGDGRHLLSTPIGVGEDGAPVVLDLKEAAEGGKGPHGLMVGATGSGKSELLRTLVTGLALSHAPEDLAFVLVDYKGGATFAELSPLPHIAGMITNLERDLSLVDRMHEALFGELERRQRVLQDAGSIDRVRDYQRRRQERPDDGLPPMPSLFLVVDEFGELLTSRPDFLDLFVSIGRTGRSLGVHLLLATQRLDEGRIRGLEGHLRYRICLRTFSADESLVALGTRDAFELPPLPGLGFLKVDSSMVRFKAALVSRPYREHRSFVEEPDVVRAFGVTGPGPELAVVGETVPSEPSPQRSVRTEMQVVVDALAKTPAERVRQVWLAPLPSALTLDAVVADHKPEDSAPGSEGWLRIPVGLRDRPRAQVQEPFVLDFTGAEGHLAVVGAPRSGKSALLQTIVGSLALTHDPGDVQMYCVDLGGGGLHALAGVPHVGAVYGRGDRDGIYRLVRELRALAVARAAEFRRHELAGMADHHSLRRQGRLASRYGEVFLFVDNWALFAQEFEDLEPEVIDLAASGLHYGIHVVVAGNRWNDMRLSLRDNVGGRIELRLNDPIESEVDRGAAKALVDATPGRGLSRARDHVQAALPRVDGRADVGGLGLGIEGLVTEVAARWSGSASAPQILMLPAEVLLEDIPDPATDPEPGVAIGIEEFGLEPVRVDLFEGDPHFVIYGDGESGKTTLLRGWTRGMAEKHPPEAVRIAVVDYRRTLLGAVPRGHLFGYACTPDQAAEVAARLAAELSARLPSGQSAMEHLQPDAWSGPRFVLFVDDYDLVAGPAGNPLGDLVGLLAQGRDVGFHLVLARRVGGAARSSFEPLLQRVRELSTPGLVMSGDPNEGPLIGVQKGEPLPPGRGYLIRRRRTSLVQVALFGDGERERAGQKARRGEGRRSGATRPARGG
jgi:S-DNA-T family DNA segregation ATPase FtsK/SpoIIIE